MGFSGDLKPVRELPQLIARMVNPTERIAARAKPAVEALELGAVASTVGPDGAPWAPLRNGGEPSGSIVHRVRVVQDGNRIKTRLDRIASYHQRGTKNMVARKLMPDAGDPPPPAWGEAIDAAAREVLGEPVR